MKKRWSFSAVASFFAAVFMTGAATLVFLPVYRNAEPIGEGIGYGTGTLAGATAGSLQGIAQASEAYASGIEEGLQAEDTETEIRSSLSRVGKLNVLAADVSIQNLNQMGLDLPNYSMLQILSGQAVFSVDLAAAEITFSPDEPSVRITLPQPELDLRLDMSKTRTLAEYQRNGVSISEAKGYEAYIHSLTQVMEKSSASLRDYIVNYEALQERARTSAETQVRRFAAAVQRTPMQISIAFRAEGGVIDGQ